MEQQQDRTALKKELYDSIVAADLEYADRILLKGDFSEIDAQNVSKEAFTKLLVNNNILNAVSIYSRFNFPVEGIINLVIDKFNMLVKDNKFVLAFYLGHAFDLSKKRTLTAAIKGYQQLMADNNMNEVMRVDKKFNVLHSEDIHEVEEFDREDFIKAFETQIITKLITENKINVLHQYVDTLGIQYNYEHNPVLSIIVKSLMEAVLKKHRELMEEGNASEAFVIAKNFKLIEEETPLNVKAGALEIAEKTHHKKIQEYDLKGALFIKNKYGLFVTGESIKPDETLIQVLQDYVVEALKKGQSGNAAVVVKEYELKQDVIQKPAAIAISQLLPTDEIAKVINIVRSLDIEITEPKTISDVTIKFHQMYEKDKMDVASDLGFFFKLKEPRVKKAAMAHWDNLINEGEFDRALEFKNERRLPLQSLEPIVKQAHAKLMNESKKEEASLLLDQYKLKVSFWDWLKNLFSGG